MTTIDNRTPHGNHPLPHPDNVMATDAVRIADALTGLDADIHELRTDVEQSTAAANDVLALPAAGTAVQVGRKYYLPAGGAMTMPTTAADDDTVEIIPTGAIATTPASVTFAHPVEDDEGTQLTAGTHSYNSSVNRVFVFKSGVWR